MRSCHERGAPEKQNDKNPKGAVVAGRIRGLERLHSPETAIDLTIELAQLEWEDKSAEFYGELLLQGSGFRVPAFFT